MDNYNSVNTEKIRKNLKTKDRLILSMDVPNKNEVLSILRELENSISTVKIGLELIYNEGTKIIDTVIDCGYKVLLDAKLMDIPNTIAGALKGISKLGVSMITMHTFGGSGMMTRAKEELLQISSKNGVMSPLLFGVTVLTSLDDSDLNAFGFKTDYASIVKNLARTAIESKIDGIICSPNEVSVLRESFGNDFLIATPGIRLPEDDAGDQKRYNTPEKAIDDGADFIIVGRSIIKSKNKIGTVSNYLERMERR
ncbi:MAG: orotidine-5'-phosphate decarboxylase [Actinomycetota bacterium]|nr:orotidine-5'-phosphate decarboxylase [Actinomycetota bacterium]